MHYEDYSTEDFLADESFQAFALGHDPAATQHWQQWLAQHPPQEAAAREALAVLALLRTARRPGAPAALRQQETQKLRRSLQPEARPLAVPRLRSSRRAWRWVGALVAVGLAGLRWWGRPVLGPPSPTYARYVVPPGQQRQVQLPDGSQVVLNGNSVLTLAAAWPAGQAREVWLRGSAYFDVRHLAPPALKAVLQAPDSAKFTVHTGPLDVAVLGTQFTVLSRGSRTNVVLSSGQVALSKPRTPATRLLLKPGELAEYDAAAPAAPLRKRPVAARLYAAWVSGQLEFTDMPVADLVTMLQDAYGLMITVNNPQLLRQQLTGALPTHDLDGLLAAFGKILDVPVRRQGSHVWL
jgi:ferric-dicitrate binding protein FerR (iron transport regulator)